jgi:Gram-negative bacterial TonB protein C-terminal
MHTQPFRIVCSLLLAGTVLFLAGAAPEDADLHNLENKLREAFVGRGATLQKFYTSNDLEFDDQGKLLNESKIGSWTNSGRIQVSSLKFKETTLAITGKRDVAEWDKTAGEFKNYPLDSKVHITIHLQPGYTTQAVLTAIDHVFMTRDTFLSDLAPDYWKELLATERQRRIEWNTKKQEAMKDVVADGAGVTAPKLLSKPEGIQTSLTPFADPEDNQVLLWYVVNKNGEVQMVEITKPVGLGIDDPIADTILKWKFEPAMQDGHPVAVLMHARYTLKTPSGHIDPYHTLPCPGIDNVFAC